MAIRWIALLLFSFYVAGPRAATLEMSLADLIEALEVRGHRILYSARLVPRERLVQVEQVNLDALSQVLVTIGLALQEREGLWVIVRDDPQEEPAALPSPQPEQILESVIVTGSRHSLPYIGGTQSGFSFSPENLALVPTLGSDALRAALRLPGVSSVGVSAKPRIRGGLQDELLVLQDGVELLEPFHLADYHSPYSGIDYHTIESLEVYTGGFPSRYGYRMSGVMNIGNQWREDDYRYDIGVSSFSAFIHARGDLEVAESSNWLLSFRQGDLSDLTDYIDTRSGDPRYKDAAARMNVQLTKNVQVSGGLVYAQDDIRFRDDEERSSAKIDNAYGWLGAEWLLSANLASRLNFSAIDFERRRRQEGVEIDPDDPGKGGFLDHDQDIHRLAVRNDWAAFEGVNHWEFGWQLEYNEGDYQHRSEFDRGELAQILGTQEEVERDFSTNPDGWSGGSYLQLERSLSERLVVQPSLRLDFQDYYSDAGSDVQLSPRFGIAYDLGESTQLRLSLGRFHQQEGIHELQVIDGVSRFYAPQRLDQVVAGVQWLGEDAELMAEFYYKSYDDLKVRFENIFNPFVLLPELEPDRVELAPGKAKVSGFDLDSRVTIVEPLQGYFRYSYMDAKDRIDSEWVDRRWSQRHTVNSGLVWQGESYSISVAGSWHSGWRSSVVPRFVPEDETIALSSILNNTVLQDYFSLDVGARKSWEFPRARIEIYADVINLTNRKNQAGVDFDIEEITGGYLLSPDAETLLRRVISVGITLSF